MRIWPIMSKRTPAWKKIMMVVMALVLVLALTAWPRQAYAAEVPVGRSGRFYVSGQVVYPDAEPSRGRHILTRGWYTFTKIKNVGWYSIYQCTYPPKSRGIKIRVFPGDLPEQAALGNRR
jgi:hypothetical protein